MPTGQICAIINTCKYSFASGACETPAATHPANEHRSSQYKEGIHNSVLAYRKYYINDKKDIAKWNKSRPMPDWYTNKKYKVELEMESV